MAGDFEDILAGGGGRGGKVGEDDLIEGFAVKRKVFAEGGLAGRGRGARGAAEDGSGEGRHERAAHTQEREGGFAGGRGGGRDGFAERHKGKSIEQGGGGR